MVKQLISNDKLGTSGIDALENLCSTLSNRHSVRYVRVSLAKLLTEYSTASRLRYVGLDEAGIHAEYLDIIFR